MVLTSKLSKIPSYAFLAFCLILGILGFTASNANAKRYYGACGGGTTLSDFIAGAKAHGVADDYAKRTGQTPGLDGSATKIMKDNYVRVILTKATTVNNDTCKGGKLVHVNRKFLPAGTRLWVPAKSAPAKGKRGVVKFAGQENCGNGAHGNMHVKRPGHKAKKHKKKRKKHKKPVSQNGEATGPVIVQSPGACDSQNAGNQTGPGTQQGSCNTQVVNCYGMGSCSPTTVQTNYSTQIEECVNKGGNWNGDTNVCTYTENPCNCTTTPPLQCPAGSTPNETNTECVKDGSTTPPPTGDTGTGTNPPDTSSTSSQCYWQPEGYTTTDGVYHPGGSAVDSKYLGPYGACPTGSWDGSA